MNGPRLLQVDAFTETPFSGNPAAVCLLQGPADGAWMQRVAAQMNLSETAFVHREEDVWRLRWFTPTTEVDLCGHATLATAHALWEEGEEGALTFRTRSGDLGARRDEDGIWLDFPAQPGHPVEPPEGLAGALGVHPLTVQGNRFDLLLELADADTVRGLAPDFQFLSRLPVRGVIVTARGEGDHDFVSRFFAPGAGIDEDPVTGSAHCFLGPFWGARLKRDALTGYQASARGGTVRVRLNGERVMLGGGAVTVWVGRLRSPAPL